MFKIINAFTKEVIETHDNKDLALAIAFSLAIANNQFYIVL